MLPMYSMPIWWALLTSDIARLVTLVAATSSESSGLGTAANRNVASGFSGLPPWHPSSGGRTLQEQKVYEELPPIVFSPTGRLHPVELIAKATTAPFNPWSNLVVALTCKNGLVVISTVPLSSSLNSTLLLVNETEVPIMTQLSPSLAAATAGVVIHGQVMRHKIHQVADSLHGTKGHDTVHPYLLARKLADHLQVATQTSGGKGGPLLASTVVILGNRQLWQIDPTGQFWRCHAVVIGCGSVEAQVELYEHIAKRLAGMHSSQALSTYFDNLDLDEAVELACMSIRKACLPNRRETRHPSMNVPSIYWQGLVMDYSQAAGSNTLPRRRILRGRFEPPKPISDQ